MPKPKPNAATVGLLRVSEVAEELRVSRPTAYRIVASGALDPRVQVGERGTIRITREALNAYIAKNLAALKAKGEAR